MKKKEYKLRKLSWSVPGNTRHREYTVTDMCYLIMAKTPCSGCTLVGVQKPEPGVLIDPKLPPYKEEKYRINIPFVTAVAQREVDKGINLITYMGGEPLTIKDFNKVVKWTVEHPILNGLIYSSSAYFFKPDENLSEKLNEYEETGLFSSRFGHFKASVDMLIRDKKNLFPLNHPLRGEAFKSYYGLKLTEVLAGKGYQVAIHQTLKSHNLDHVIPLYEWAKERGIRYSMCPLVWVPYISNGQPENFYRSHLTSKHQSQLQEIVDYIISDTVHRFLREKKRIYVPSSAFTKLMPKYGSMNKISCRKHRLGKRPNGQDLHPNGQERWCIAQNKREDGLRCRGCFYIGIDRDGDFWNFEHLAGLKKNDLRFLNADIWIKDPQYDPNGKNLFFDYKGHPLD